MSSLIKLTRTIHFLRTIHNKYNACMYLCMYTNIIWMCMIKARIRWCSCRVENILTLCKLLRLWFCFLLHSIFFNLKPLFVHKNNFKLWARSPHNGNHFSSVNEFNECNRLVYISTSSFLPSQQLYPVNHYYR